MSVICITLRDNGEEAFKDEYPDGYFPRNGFQKGNDGCFYKQLGDPRCISDAEKRRALELEEERKKPTNPLHSFRNNPQLQSALAKVKSNPGIISGNDYHTSTIREAEGKTTIKTVIFFQNGGKVRHIKEDEIVEILKPSMINSCGFKELNVNYDIYKIILHRAHRTISVWYKDGTIPDAVITNAL
jgi:hypothetical protein